MEREVKPGQVIDILKEVLIKLFVLLNIQRPKKI